jgi:hypothetical protein
VLDVDVLEDVVVWAIGSVVDGGGMHVDAGIDDDVGSVVGGAAAAPDPKAPAITATAMAARRTSGAADPCVSRRCTAKTPRPVTIARAPMSSVAPNDPPELGRLHTWSMALGGSGRRCDGAEHNAARHAAAAELQQVRNLRPAHSSRKQCADKRGARGQRLPPEPLDRWSVRLGRSTSRESSVPAGGRLIES